jgi:hypothetical protein
MNCKINMIKNYLIVFSVITVSDLLKNSTFPVRYRKVNGTLLCCDVMFSLRLSNQALLYEDVWGSECIVPCVLDLGISSR